jgi:IS30 family transposase
MKLIQRCALLIYSSFEKGINDYHNGFIRRSIHKDNRILNYTYNDIDFIEEWMNTIHRRILSYQTPEDLFEVHLDEIYVI